MNQPFHLPSLPPPGNPRIHGLASGRVLSPDEAAALAGAFDPVGGAAASGADVRLDDVVDQLAAMTAQANTEYFRFELTGVVGEGEPRFLHVAESGSLADYDVGLTGDESTRKLVVLLALAIDGTTADDATIDLPVAGKSNPLKPGMAYVWPAFLDATWSAPNGVHLLVLHAHGPAFV